MSVRFTTHVRRRAHTRNLSAAKVRESSFSPRRKYLGHGKYKADNSGLAGGVSVIYKKDKGKKILITAWKR